MEHRQLWLAAIALTSTLVLAAPRADVAQRPASTAEVEHLTQLVAQCPSIAPKVGSALDDNYGVLDAASMATLVQQAERCIAQQRDLPPTLRQQSALAGLQRVVAGHAPMEAEALRLNAALPEALPLRFSHSLSRTDSESL
nr:hypothetical protein [Oceanococcus sp. HetDA_MAG_MS8]